MTHFASEPTALDLLDKVIMQFSLSLIYSSKFRFCGKQYLVNMPEIDVIDQTIPIPIAIAIAVMFYQQFVAHCANINSLGTHMAFSIKAYVREANCP